MKPQQRRCPQCGSNQVQSVEAAYVHSVRHGARYSTISEFGQRLAPPEPESTVLGPVLFGIALYVSVIVVAQSKLAGPFSLFPWVLVSQGHGWFIAVLLTGCTVLVLASSAQARHRNNTDYAELERAWKSDMVCRTCLHRFPSSTTAVDR